MLFQTSLGIDIGEKTVSLAYLSGSFKGPRLRSYATYPVDAASTEEKMELIGGVVRDFLHDNKISPASVFWGVPRNLAILRYVEVPSAVRENLKESLGYQMDKYVPFSVDDLYYDCQEIGEDKERETLRVLLVAAKKEMLDPYISLANKLKVGVSGIEIRSTAIANYFASQVDLKENRTSAFVHIDDGGVDLGFLRSGALCYSRYVEIAGPNADPGTMIVGEVDRIRQKLGEDEGTMEVFLSGSETGAQLLDTLGEVAGVDFHMADLSNGLPSNDMIPAYGLAAKGIMKLPIPANLMPERLRKKPNRVGQYTMLVTAGLLLLTALAWGSGKIVSQQLYLSRLNTEIDRLSVEVAETERIRAKMKEVEKRIDFLNGYYTNEASVLQILKELSVRIPKSAWVRGLTFSDGELRITGLADSSSELVSLLDESDIFKDVAFVSSITRSRQGTERFRIKLKLNK